MASEDVWTEPKYTLQPIIEVSIAPGSAVYRYLNEKKYYEYSDVDYSKNYVDPRKVEWDWNADSKELT